MIESVTRRALAPILFSLTAAAGMAQDATAPAPRNPEGSRIINFPSGDVPAAGTLGVLFTHRFAQPLEDSDWHSLLSFDSGADIGIGASYVPLQNLEVAADRSSNQDDWEIGLKYRLFERSASFPLSVALRTGMNIRTEIFVDRENTYFAQGIAGVAIGPRIRVTVIPTWVSRTAGTPFVSQPQEDAFNVFGALAVSLSRTVNLQGEVIPRRGRFGSPGVGWIAAIEKTVLRHRFAFTVGNVRNTTVDQYIASDFNGLSPHEYYIGFNLARSWKLK
ncbi:MAG: DUF5777 family beta-barrel protein [Thermoanaerobaculia bacterium]